ncbi:GNAT family N-acetyltransferase [Streptomyces sp. NPDC058284]|uniref:GNAT family N-acetyltransferase n=1 Tax=unclassified Streptomyces TaxID=2593676 RepID=UPI00364E59DE
MPDMHIRIARPEDDDELARLDRATWSTLHAVQPRPEPPYEPFFNDRFGPRDHLIAEVAGRIVGYVKIGFPTPLLVNAHVRQIQGFVVAEEVRGRGIGTRLIRAAMDEARRQGARRITLRVLGHNTPARKLYEAEGFVIEGVLPGEFLLAGEYVDDILMGRPL